MKKFFTVAVLVSLLLATACMKDYRLLKDYYPSTTDAPKNVIIVPTFPAALEEGAVPDVLTLKLTIKNNGDKDVMIDPAKIYISVRTDMHAALNWETVAGQNKKADISALAMKQSTLGGGDEMSGTLYFPKAVAEKIEADGLFTLNVDAGYGKKIIVVYKK